MAGIQLSGLASGLDWKSLVSQLIEVQRTPQTQMRKEQTANTSKSSALADVKNLLTNFQTSLSALSSEGGFQQRKTTLSGASTGWSAEAESGTPVGSYEFNVIQTAANAKRLGGSDVSSGISATNDVSGLLVSALRTNQTVTAGEFTVNGAKVAVATTDTLQEVFDKISTATSGAVTASYDATSDAVTLTGAGTITLGSAADTSNFLGNMKLFNNGTGTVSSSGQLGATKLTVPIAQAGLKTAVTGDSGGNGTFKINGKEISYNVNTDSIQTVLGRINASDAGVSASYDSSLDRFVLTNKTAGDVGIFVEESGTGFLAATGLNTASSTLQSGRNAVFTINGGGNITSTSNTLDATSHGITGLTVTAGNTGAQTVNVASDTSNIRTKLDDMIAKYNSVQTAIDNYTKVTVNGSKVTSGVLAGNRDIAELSSKLRAMVFSASGDTSSSVQRLADMGIDFSSTGSGLAIRSATALTSKLADEPGDVEAFFTDATTGLAAKLKDFIDDQTATTGFIATQTDNLTKRNTAIDKQIEEMERQLEIQKTMMESSFTKMEESSSYYQQQGAQLSKMFSS